jgi:hypothetical protein
MDHSKRIFLMLAVPQAPSPTTPRKQGLSHGTKDSRAAKQRRFSLTTIFSWKKLKVSPVITSVTSSEEVGLVERLQRLDLQSQWSNLPDHLLESIFMLMKDGDKDDWAHVQVASLPKPTGCMQWCTCAFLAHPSTSRQVSCCALRTSFSEKAGFFGGVSVHAFLFSANTNITCTPDA